MLKTALALALLLASPALASSPTEDVITVSAPAGLEFHAICAAAKIPCAIELDAAVSGDPRGRQPFRAENATVSQAMNQAIRRYSGHRWRYRKGVLYVTPNAPDPKTPLDRPLGREKFTESVETLRQEFGETAGFCAAPRADAASEPAAAEKVSLTVADATPRAVLNAFVFRRWSAGWVLVRTAGARPLYCLDFLLYR